MAITKKQRQEVYEKYNGHCAYCGKPLEIKNMQVDHIIPQRQGYYIDEQEKNTDSFDNLNPSCRQCNHYKRAKSLERFRELLLTLHERIAKNYICKVAEDYGVIQIKPWDGKFYFETRENKK